MKILPIVGLALVSIVLTGCFGMMELGTPHVEELTNGYCTSSGIDYVSITKIDDKSPSPGRYLIYNVQDIDWDDTFITVKSIEYSKRSSANVLTWYIIDVTNDQIHGPLSYDEYVLERNTLSVPGGLEFLKPDEGEWAAYHRKHSQRSEVTTLVDTSYMPYVGGAVVLGLLLIAVGIRTRRSGYSH